MLVLAPCLARAGGIQRYTAMLVRAFKELLGEESVRCIAMAEAPDRNGHDRFSPGLKLRFVGQALWETTRWRPELIVCTHLALGPVGWLASGLAGRPYWVVVHGIEGWASLPVWKRVALRKGDRVIVTSSFNRVQVLNRHRIDAERMASLPCALDETLLNVEPARDGVHRHLSRDRRVVLTVARMAASERYKGHDVVLRALPAVVARVPNLTYIVVGGGDDRERLERLAQDLGIAGHVLFAGEVGDSELVALYRRSDVFVLPARTVTDDHNPKGEGFGIVFLEAMAFGKPVIGPNYGAPAELIRHGECGFLVDPEDPAAVADALLHLLNAPEEVKSMGESATRWVRQEYSFKSLCRRLGAILVDSGYGNSNLPGHRATHHSFSANRSSFPRGHS